MQLGFEVEDVLFSFCFGGGKGRKVREEYGLRSYIYILYIYIYCSRIQTHRFEKDGRYMEYIPRCSMYGLFTYIWVVWRVMKVNIPYIEHLGMEQ